MKKFVKRRIGNELHTYEVQGENLYDCQMQEQKLSFEDVERCGLCLSTHLRLRAIVAQKKYKYLFIECMNCKAKVNFGKKIEDPDVYYLKRKQDKTLDWNVYNNEYTSESNNNLNLDPLDIQE